MISESEIAFITACKEGNLELAQTFLQYNSDLDVSVFNEYAFITSCENGYLEIVQWLLKVNQNINISACNDDAFVGDCRYGHLKVAQYLLKVKQDINISTNNNSSFIWACKYGHFEVVQWLQTLKPFKYSVNFKIDIISWKINTNCEESLLILLYSLTCKNYKNNLTPDLVINFAKYI